MSINTDGWICPQNPIGHEWAEGKQRCFLCGHTRPATEAVLSLLSGSRACSEVSARMLLDALVAEAAPPVPQDVAAARALLDAYMPHESDADQAEFTALVDAVIAAETATLQARIAELEKPQDGDQADRSRWSDAERIIERAHDKGSGQIDTDLLVEALGLDQT